MLRKELENNLDQAYDNFYFDLKQYFTQLSAQLEYEVAALYEAELVAKDEEIGNLQTYIEALEEKLNRYEAV